jgi:N-ethylmaleimide reductase
MILNVGLDAQSGGRLIAEGAGDLVAFGRDYISNPDLVERIRTGAALNPYNAKTFYLGDHKGYTDYPFLNG